MKNPDRRKMLGGLVTGTILSLSMTNTGCEKHKEKENVHMPLKKYSNKEFYTTEGKFDSAKAKEAYFELMKFHNYPIFDILRSDDFWVADFGKGIFTEVGMGGIFWVNDEKYKYLGHEIYLLPGQMIPEHRHLTTAKAAPKMEAWQVRHGSVHIYGEGAPTTGVANRIPPSHKKCIVAQTEKLLKSGELGVLAGPEQWHWMLAGSEGAIVTEYATFHDNDALRFTLDGVAL